MGRKPKPTALKLISGNPGQRPLNHHEPVPAGVLDDAPAWMTDSQRSGWAYAIAHAPAGLLRPLDRSALTAWVIAEDLHRHAAEKIAQFGLIVKTPKSGTPVQSPYLSIVNKQASIMLKAASELGFTPTARSRIIAPTPSTQRSRFANNIGP